MPQDLDRRGLVGRHAHPAGRREIGDRIAHCDAEIVRLEAKLAELHRQLEAHSPVVAARTTWERKHGSGLQRLHDLDRTSELIERVDHVATRRLGRGAEGSLGIELGLSAPIVTADVLPGGPGVFRKARGVRRPVSPDSTSGSSHLDSQLQELMRFDAPCLGP